jgi:hypothetical protein
MPDFKLFLSVSVTVTVVSIKSIITSTIITRCNKEALFSLARVVLNKNLFNKQLSCWSQETKSNQQKPNEFEL